MRLVATLLLAAMAGLFALSLAVPTAHPAVPWLRAFAEAGMVGGLADWFAVTALFRRPLGLPIPHTAIIPNQKDRLGDALAAFLKDNFLRPQVLARRLEQSDLAGAAARWLARPAADGRRSNPLATALTSALDDPAIAAHVNDSVNRHLAGMRVSPLVADAVDALVDSGRHDPLVDAAINWALATLSSEEPGIREQVSARTNWLLRLAGADDSMADTMIGTVQRLLVEMAGDRRHPVRQRLETAIRQWAFDLRHFPETQARVEGLWADLRAHPAVADWIADLWPSARAALARGLDAPGGGRIGAMLQALSARITSDASLRSALNAGLRRLVAGIALARGDAIVRLVSDTIRRWDAETVTSRVEQAVGRDLQFIRINGTLIGGCIGLAIHGVAVMAGG